MAVKFQLEINEKIIPFSKSADRLMQKALEEKAESLVKDYIWRGWICIEKDITSEVKIVKPKLLGENKKIEEVSFKG